ncbi:hypothetical protein [Rubripirellula reticaptiva]|uniref:Hemerythrin-like domain-containing protein n=1 Tax=Rubripirellula reticaptiva TaxID=2528013 RepID=A0A5C6ED55_9BACT|nr:hypothetical protein [Rubripirellula reticaptiva]TWU46415.1 hypothetical protein Poly59_53570 [Rubripirellula reticaptiva]
MAVISTATAKTVNPAFLQEIKDSNPDLWTVAENLRRAYRADGEPTEVLRRLTRLLNDLRDALSLQFSLEESYGYIAVPEPHNEAFSDLAIKVAAEHGTLYLMISDLAEQAEELQYRGVQNDHLCRLIEQTRQFDRLWCEHERLEADMIDQSFDSINR